MIVKNDKTFETNSLFPNIDWYNEENYVIDETKEENQELIRNIKTHAPYMELIVEGGKIIEIVPIERPTAEPIEVEPSTEEYLLDLDYRLSLIELGL